MAEESDLEIILEDEVNDDEVIILEDNKKDGKNGGTVSGGINDAYWNKCRMLFHPTTGIDGMMSIQDTIKASIALLFECNDTLFFGSLLERLQRAVVSGASVLTHKHLSDSSKRTAYYALTTMNGYGLFPRGFIYLCINLLGEDRSRIRAVLEPFKKISHNMKGQLNFISKCEEKRVGKNPELHAKCRGMQEMADKFIVWQYPKIFDEIDNEKWPDFVKTAIIKNDERREENRKKKMMEDEEEKNPWDKYSKERIGKLKNKMSSIQDSHFWGGNCKMWGMECEVDGQTVINTAMKLVREIDALYGGNLIGNCRVVNKWSAFDDRDLFDPTRQHPLRFIELLDKYCVFGPKGIYILILRAIILDESLMGPCIDLLNKIKDKVNENIELMVKLAPKYANGTKSSEKDPAVTANLVSLREYGKNQIYPHLPTLFGGLKCTRVPGVVAHWMKSSPMTKSGIKDWCDAMGVETDLNFFPLITNEEFVAPEMGDEYMEEDDKKEKEKKERWNKRKEKKEEKKEEKKKERMEKMERQTVQRKNRPSMMIPPGVKPIGLLDQIISNPFHPNSVPFNPMAPPPSGLLPPPYGLPPPVMGGPPRGVPPPSFMVPPPHGMIPPPSFFPPPPSRPSLDGMSGVPSPSTVNTNLPPPSLDYHEVMRRKEEDEEKMKLERMARLMMGGGMKEEKDGRDGRDGREERRERERERGDRGEKRGLSVEDEMIEREKRLQRWLEEKNGGSGGRREERNGDRRRDRGDEDRRRRRSRSRSRDRDQRSTNDFERRVEELERKKKEKEEEKEREMKELCVEHWRKVKGSFRPMDESKWEFRPEWGVTTVWRRVSGHSKWEEKVKDKLELLDIKIKDHFVNNVQTPDEEQKKKIVWERLQDGLQAKLDGCGVFFLMAGSSSTSFATRSSNLDLVMISPLPHMTPETIRHIFFPDLPFLISQRGGKVTREEALWMEFECSMAGVSMGVRIAIDAGAHYFSKIMTIYDNIDKRVSILLHYVKHWTTTHFRRPEDVSKYLLTTLVLHYLQSGVSPPLLPCLHLLYPSRLTPDAFSSFDYASPFDPPLPQCHNSQSPSSLLIGFFMYYASFDFSRYAISIGSGSVIRKRDLGVAVPDFAVEHPFDGSFTAVVNEPFSSSHFTAAMTAACQDAITNLEI